MKSNTSLLFLLFLFKILNAQQVTISGFVTDSLSGEKLIGASIVAPIRLVVIDFQCFKYREKFHKAAQTPII